MIQALSWPNMSLPGYLFHLYILHGLTSLQMVSRSRSNAHFQRIHSGNRCLECWMCFSWDAKWTAALPWSWLYVKRTLTGTFRPLISSYVRSSPAVPHSWNPRDTVNWWLLRDQFAKISRIHSRSAFSTEKKLFSYVSKREPFGKLCFSFSKTVQYSLTFSRQSI